MNRRTFFHDAANRMVLWFAALNVAGLRFCTYSAGSQVGHWRGWVEWWGRCIAFVSRDGTILWAGQIVSAPPL